jgi:hypothetical protein
MSNMSNLVRLDISYIVCQSAASYLVFSLYISQLFAAPLAQSILFELPRSAATLVRSP